MSADDLRRVAAVLVIASRLELETLIATSQILELEARLDGALGDDAIAAVIATPAGSARDREIARWAIAIVDGPDRKAGAAELEALAELHRRQRELRGGAP